MREAWSQDIDTVTRSGGPSDDTLISHPLTINLCQNLPQINLSKASHGQISTAFSTAPQLNQEAPVTTAMYSCPCLGSRRENRVSHPTWLELKL